MNTRSDSKALSEALANWKNSGTRLQLNGRSIFTIDCGDQSAEPENTLLLFHGFPESSFSYHKVLPGLKRVFARVILMDFLGFGFSDKPGDHNYTLAEQADLALLVWHHYGVRGAHLLAHDMGDSVATELVARWNQNQLPDHFDGFKSLTFTNGNMVMEKAKLRVLQVLLRKPLLGRLMSRLASYRMFRQQVLSASGGQSLQEEDIEHMWELNCLQGGKKISYRLIRYLDERDQHQNSRWLPALGKLEVPIHLCWGSEDSVAPVAVVNHLKEHICPQATLSILDGVGHFAQQENPDLWLSTVCDFWDLKRPLK